MNDIEALITGFKEFKDEYTSDKQGKYRDLAEYGPHSKILMIACCDSRVDPAIITNSSAGDLMVIRNIANLVPPYWADGSNTTGDASDSSLKNKSVESSFHESQAAIEFAVCYLGVEHIIVMGHSRCGGIRSLLTRLVDDSDAILPLDKWTSIAEPAAKKILAEMPEADLDEKSCACSREALTYSLKNLKTYPWIAEKLETNTIELHGWYFNLSTGDLQCYKEDEHIFESLY